MVRDNTSLCLFSSFINGENAHKNSVMLHNNTSLCVCLAHRILSMGKVHGKVMRCVCVCDDPSPCGKCTERWCDVA